MSGTCGERSVEWSGCVHGVLSWNLTKILSKSMGSPRGICKRQVTLGTRKNKKTLESRRRRTKGSVVGEEWCQNAAPLRWYTKNVFAQSKMILSRAWLHDTVSCAAWNDARKGVYLKPLFKTPCSNCYWGWSIPIMLDYRDISLMVSVPLMWGPVTASPVGIEPMTILEGEGEKCKKSWLSEVV